MDKSKILKEIQKSSKYTGISSFTIDRLIENGLRRYKKEKDVTKYVKKELHIVWGIFFKKILDFNKYIDNPEELLHIHRSTDERYSFVQSFYTEIFKYLPGNITNIADYGCGFNPLNIQYMPLKENTNYYAYDIYKPEIEFLNKYADIYLKNIHFTAEVKDIFEEDINRYDVVFLLKMLPILEEQSKGCTEDILKKFNTEYLVISFPLKTVSGRDVGMESFYTKNFEDILNKNSYTYTRLFFENEVVYVVRK